MQHTITFRPAKSSDASLILEFVRELATYEKLLHEVEADEKSLAEYLFGEKAYAEVILAFAGETPAGFCLFFHNFSTFVGRPGIYIEDVFVRPEFRGHGIGKQFFGQLATIATERGCGRIEWWVLDWNQPAIDFYCSLGAKPMDEWTVYRITRDRFQALRTDASSLGGMGEK
jgi:GNAT superfamily N-acetyltransferase